MKEKLYNALPFVLLISGLVVTFLFFRNELRWHEISRRTYYQDQLEKIRQNIAFRLQTYVDEQVAAGAFVASSEQVNRYDWRDFVTALQLDINYPGIYGLGFAVPVNKSDSLAFVMENRRDRAPDFSITSLGKVPGAKEFFVIKFIEPQLRNHRALGFDMGSDPTRRRAMEKARNTGKAAISDRVVLVQDKNRTPGFLIYVPVFRSEALEENSTKRFLGWAYAPFVAENFMKGVLQRELSRRDLPYQVELYDGARTDTSKLLYRSWVVRPEMSDSTYTASFPVYNNQWTLRLLPVRDYETAKGKTLAYVILFGGILLNVSLFFLLRTLANTRENALKLADKMTLELRELNHSLDRKVAERTQELAAKNKQLSNYAENLKNAYEDMEVKVKFRNLQLAKEVKALQEEISRLKNSKG
ncbi:CHASE domain-containing protein [Adhaeribacter sp. BT258]|uniref:CHASE domain-containing protein n=1 Tax=Adhaeribacter terrigena TaxID=2793070 RepID=A0ABS1C3Q7_9BACT|nr:CHASE domain-containing protein [Adhaeribacter terrigena]MBK0404035.1 CHASE domain-containing protein [Adhaeribacter terrigena]